MENLSLNAEVRGGEERTSDLRSSNILPWVVYGNNQEPISLKMVYGDFLKLFRKSGNSHIISLKVGKKTIEVLVHDSQKHPVTGDFIHIDFYAITKGEAVTTNISLNFVWQAPAAKKGAIIDEQIKDIEVKCLPADLVDNFEVDLSALVEIDDTIRVSDLKLWDKYNVQIPENTIVVSAAAPAKVEDLDAPIADEPVTGADEATETEETEEK